jgi:hypothetical protein
VNRSDKGNRRDGNGVFFKMTGKTEGNLKGRGRWTGFRATTGNIYISVLSTMILTPAEDTQRASGAQ